MMKFKKWISLLLAVVLAVSSLAASTIALADTSGDFEYTVLDDGTAEITKYIGSNTTVKIPDIIENHKVTSIKYTYDLFPDIQVLYIPYSIDQIKNLNQYNYHGFENCYDLKEIVVDENNNNFTSKDGVLFNKDMTELLAFPKDKKISSYTVPDSVTTIKDTFSYCKHVTEIKIPANTTDISLGYYADNTLFHNCKNLNSIDVDPSNSAYSSQDGVLFNKDKTELIRYPMDKNITQYEIPDTVTHLGWYSFLNCNKIQTIYIPESVINIGWYTFGICESLTDIFYAGSEEQWNNISISTENYDLYNVAIHYNWQAESDKDPILSDGTDTEYVIGSDSGASIHCSYALNDFVSVTMDYETVDPSNYALAEGSTILTFDPDYLDTLSIGEHTVTLNYTNASVSSVLTIIANTTVSEEDTISESENTSDSGTSEENNVSDKTEKVEADNQTQSSIATGAGKSTKSPSTGANSAMLAALTAGICAGTAVLITAKGRRRQK